MLSLVTLRNRLFIAFSKQFGQYFWTPVVLLRMQTYEKSHPTTVLNFASKSS